MARRPPKFHSEHATECIYSVCLQWSLQWVSVSAHPAHRNVSCAQHSAFPSFLLKIFQEIQLCLQLKVENSNFLSIDLATYSNNLTNSLQTKLLSRKISKRYSSSAAIEPMHSDLKTYQALNSSDRR